MQPGTYPEGETRSPASLKNIKAWRGVQVDQVLPHGDPSPLKKLPGCNCREI